MPVPYGSNLHLAPTIISYLPNQRHAKKLTLNKKMMENVLKQILENEFLWRKMKEWEQQEGSVTAPFRILPILHESTMTSAEQNVPAEMNCVQFDEEKIMKNKICWSLIKNEWEKIWEKKGGKKLLHSLTFQQILKNSHFFNTQTQSRSRLLW